MSGKSSAVMFIFVVAIALAAGKADDLGIGTGLMGAARESASVAVAGKPTFTEAPAIGHTEKARGPAAVAIELVGAPPAAPGDTFILRGVISSRRAISDLKFNWGLPSGVELVNGESSGLIAAVTPGQNFVIQLTLRARSAVNEQIHLAVTGGSRPGTRFGDTAQFNTMTQALLDESRRELARSTEAHAKSGEAKPVMRRRGKPAATAEPDREVFQ